MRTTSWHYAQTFVSLVGVSFLPGLLLSMPPLIAGKGGEALWVFYAVSKVAIVATILLGVPAIYILNRARASRWYHYAGAGIVCSLIVFLYFRMSEMHGQNLLIGWPAFAAQYILVAILGVIVAVSYWCFTRPDRGR